MKTKTKIHWVTGKGGVGKSTFAFMKARQLAEGGRKTLLVEIGDKSFFSYVLGSKISFKELEVGKNLYVSHWAWIDCLKDYVSHLVKVSSLVNLFFENDVMKNVVSVAPGLAEISILGKLTSGVRASGPGFEWDEIVFDAHATGHCLSYLRAPKALNEAIGIGPLGQNAKAINDVLLNTEITKFYLVTIPEDLPTVESLEFGSQLKKEFGINVQMVMNQFLMKTKISGSLTELSGEERDFAMYVNGKLEKQEEATAALSSYEIKYKIPFIGRSSEYLKWIDTLRGETHGLG